MNYYDYIDDDANYNDDLNYEYNYIYNHQYYDIFKYVNTFLLDFKNPNTHMTTQILRTKKIEEYKTPKTSSQLFPYIFKSIPSLEELAFKNLFVGRIANYLLNISVDKFMTILKLDTFQKNIYAKLIISFLQKKIDEIDIDLLELKTNNLINIDKQIHNNIIYEISFVKTRPFEKKQVTIWRYNKFYDFDNPEQICGNIFNVGSNYIETVFHRLPFYIQHLLLFNIYIGTFNLYKFADIIFSCYLLADYRMIYINNYNPNKYLYFKRELYEYVNKQIIDKDNNTSILLDIF